MEHKHYFVFIVGDKQDAPLKIGVADNVQAVLAQQQQSHGEQDSSNRKLVYYEHYDQEEIALNREREIRSKTKEDTARLVASMNPNWLDLSDTLTY